MIKYFVIFIFFSMKLFSITASVIIPCHHVHFKYLSDLLVHISQQSVLPNEVIISLSEANKVPYEDYQNLCSTVYPFELNILCTDKKLYAGQNRNVACSYAHGDIFICQDADDIPHPQRIEIIKHVFESTESNIVMHKWVSSLYQGYFGEYDKKHINISFHKDSESVWNVGFVHHGNIAIRKEVFEKNQWGDLKCGEDVTFVRECLEKNIPLAVIEANLLIYRPEFTSSLANKQ